MKKFVCEVKKCNASEEDKHLYEKYYKEAVTKFEESK